MDLKHVVPDMEKTFGRLTFGGEGEAEVTRGRNSRPLSRTYNLFSDVQRADDISVKITGNVVILYWYDRSITLDPRVIKREIN